MSQHGVGEFEFPPRERYLAATAAELGLSVVPLRFAAVADANLLFPHSGEAELTPEALVLHGWRTLETREISVVSLAFIPEYNRFTAGGSRVGFPSLGSVRRAGAPLVLDLRNYERIVLIVGYEVMLGVTKNDSWLAALRRLING